MDKFRKKLQFRQIALITGLVCACVAFIISINHQKGTSDFDSTYEFISGFQMGILAFLVFVMAFSIIRNSAAIIKPKRLKKLYIFETDERILFIRQKSGTVGMNIIMYGLILGAIVSGNINNTVFFTLLGTCTYVGLVRISLKLYYRKKY